MSTADNIAKFRAVPEEIFNNRDFALIDEIFAPDFIEHAAPPNIPPGREGFKLFLEHLLGAFPDFRYVVEMEVAEGDMVVGRVRASGTHQGELFGIPPTGRRAEWHETHWGRFEDGMLMEHWADLDQFSMLQQLGVIPS